MREVIKGSLKEAVIALQDEQIVYWNPGEPITQRRLELRAGDVFIEDGEGGTIRLFDLFTNAIILSELEFEIVPRVKVDKAMFKKGLRLHYLSLRDDGYHDPVQQIRESLDLFIEELENDR